MDDFHLRRFTLSLLMGDKDLLSNVRLSDAEWLRVDAIAAEHRLQPLLHHEWSARAGRTLIPSSIGLNWKQAHRQAGLQALVNRSVLLTAVDCLRRAGIACVALKGASLAWAIYPAPALRPMRDIDLLVDPCAAKDAWHEMKSAGFASPDGPPSDHALAHDKHLPPLRATSGVFVELHTRVWETPEPAGHRMPTSRSAALMARAVTGAEGVAYPCAGDMLAHLVVHGIYSHWLDAGPLLLTDIEFLLDHHKPDWPSFWAEAEAERWAPAAALAFALTDAWRKPGTLARTGCPVPVPAEILEAAPDLLLQSLDRRAGARMMARADHQGWASLVMAKLREAAERPGYALSSAGRRVGQLARTVSDRQALRKARTMATLRRWVLE